MNNLTEVDQNKNNNLRQIEINNYYALRNKAFIDIFKTIIMFSIPLMILAVLSKIIVIPRSIISGASLIVIFLLIVIIIRRIISINSRDPRNFNNFTIPFDPNQKELEDAGRSSSMSDILKKEFNGSFGCFNDACCGTGMKFDSAKKKCMLDTDNFDTVDNDKNKDKDKDKDKDQDNSDFMSAINNFNNDAMDKFNELSNELTNKNLSTIHNSM